MRASYDEYRVREYARLVAEEFSKRIGKPAKSAEKIMKDILRSSMNVVPIDSIFSSFVVGPFKRKLYRVTLTKMGEDRFSVTRIPLEN